MKDPTALDLLKSFSTKFDPQKLTYLLSAQSGGLVAGQNGIWVCPDYKNVVHVCRGNVEGKSLTLPMLNLCNGLVLL